jgi:hypothetical protein
MAVDASRTRLLRLFVSSTFRDMQVERDILARLVIPRLRAALADRNIALQEVDLRWGITETMSRDGSALTVCLRELVDCFPLALGMIGRRAGWQPPRSVLDRFDPVFSKTVRPDAGMTEIEMRYALHLAGQGSEQQLLVMIRSDRLSAETSPHEAEWSAAQDFRDWIMNSLGIRAVQYDSFEIFEARVEEELNRLFASQAAGKNPRPIGLSAIPELARTKDLQALSRAVSGRRPTLITGKPGVGISWLVRRWLNNCSGGLYIDGRDTMVLDLMGAMEAHAPGRDDNQAARTLDVARLGDGARADHLTAALMARLTQLRDGRGIVFDHFEDGFASETRADLAWIPTRLPSGCSIILVTRNERLLAQAVDLGWQVHVIDEIQANEAVTFAVEYFKTFSKHLSEHQTSMLEAAPWIGRVGSLGLALDELRRHGAIETLDRRLGELVECRNDVALVEEVVAGLRSAMPKNWSTAVDDTLFAIRVSLRGLEEAEIEAAVGALARGSAEHVERRPLPAHLWSAIRINLGSAFISRQTLFDVRGGAVLEWLDDRFLAEPRHLQRVAVALSSALEQAPAIRRWTEAPRLAEARDGIAGLERLLIEPANAVALADVGEAFMDGWIARLTPESRQTVFDGWSENLHPPCADTAWRLGLIAARAGETNAALKLLDQAAIQPAQYNPAVDVARVLQRDIVLAFLKRDALYFKRLSLEIAAGTKAVAGDSSTEVMAGLAALAACADGLVVLDRRLECILRKRVAATVHEHGDLNQMGQLHMYAGQLLLTRGRWYAAKSAFAASAREARRMGRARLLCQALERLAAVQLERNRFRSARRASIECRELAFKARLSEFEALAFERQIEVERRCANWVVAYELAAAFLDRCHQGLCDVKRAQMALATLETQN